MAHARPGRAGHGRHQPLVAAPDLARGQAAPGPLPPEAIDSIWAHFDQGTQRAILRLYRSSPPRCWRRPASGSARIEAPALVLWGTQDPYIPTRFAHDYAARLPNSELELVEDAGHWSWLDQPRVIDRVAEFLGGGTRP